MTMSSTVSPCPCPVISVAEGKLRGKTATNYLGEAFFAFQGIPYARPPIGKLRFKAPEAVEPWQGVFDATKEGPECPQKHMILAYNVGEEVNCLNLSVYTKKLPNQGSEKAALPVMVWVHGGGFVQGSNKTELFGPDYLLMEDIVLVVINYRVGCFGFLSLEDPSLNVPGNAGLKDQVMALTWVQRNIRQFGGDPDNVTVFGESAGGASVHYLLLSPLTKGLFHKVIIQSGSAINYWSYGTKGVQDVCSQLKYKHTSEKETLEYLRTVPALKLVNACHNARESTLPAERRFYAPVIEEPHPGAFISESPQKILESGAYNKVPMIMGYTSKEGLLYEVVRKIRPEAKLSTECSGEISHVIVPSNDPKRHEMAKRIKKYYFGDEPITEDNIDKTYLLKSDSVFIYDVHRAMRLHIKKADQPVYLYRMTVDTSLNLYKKVCTVKWLKSYFMALLLLKHSPTGISNSLLLKLLSLFATRNIEGAAHADDLSYLFKMFWNPKIAPDSLEEVSVKRFVKLWTNFAKYGNPTPEGSDQNLHNLGKINWKPADKNKLNFLEIGKELSISEDPDRSRMAFWDELYSDYLNQS